jgi:hypothetical protein
MRRLEVFGSVTAEIRTALIISEDEEDVGAVGGGGAGANEQKKT